MDPISYIMLTIRLTFGWFSALSKRGHQFNMLATIKTMSSERPATVTSV